MVDTLASGASGRKPVEVQILFSVPKKYFKNQLITPTHPLLATYQIVSASSSHPFPRNLSDGNHHSKITRASNNGVSVTI